MILLCVHLAHRRGQRPRLSTARPGYAIAALALYIVSLFIAGARWRGFLHALGGDVGICAPRWRHWEASPRATSRRRPAAKHVASHWSALGGRTTWRQAAIAAIWDRLSELPPIVVSSGMASSRCVVSRRAGADWIAVGVWRRSVVGGVASATAPVRIRARRMARRAWRSTGSADACSGGRRIFADLWVQDVLRLTCVTLAFGVVLSPTRIATALDVRDARRARAGHAGVGPVEGGWWRA